MRRIAVINQKGGVGKTTTSANLGAALALEGRRVVVVDMDAQANLSLALDVEAPSGSPTSYTVLLGQASFASALRPTHIPGLSLVAANLYLSGAELELASALGREFLLRDALRTWVEEERQKSGRAPADYVLFDCPPSLGLLSINALAAAGEVLITLQTEFLALQGMSKLVDVVQLLRKRLNPELSITGILPCLYDSRLKLAREVLGEIRKYFPGQVLPNPIRANVKLAEAPSYGQTIFEYAPESNGAKDYLWAAREILRTESRDPELAGLPPFTERLPKIVQPGAIAPAPRRVPPPRRSAAAGSAKSTGSGAPSSAANAKAGPGSSAANATGPAQPAAATRGTPAASSGATPARATLDATPPGPAARAPLASAPTGAPASTIGSAKPAAADAAAPASARASGSSPERRTLRAEDLPALPPDVFEILTRGGDAS